MMIPWEDGIEEFAEKIIASPTSEPKKGSPGGYYEIAVSYDSEWTSFYEGEEKRSTLYIWMLGCGPPDDAIVLFGRRTSELKDCIDALANLADTGYNKIAIYVHYLGADYQFFRRWFEWDNAFYDDSRGVYYSQYRGIEFRCELKLAGGRSLKECGDNLQIYKNFKKKTGDLDYTLKRHSETPLTVQELGYCEYDVLVSLAYITEKIIEDGSIANIPLTNTGYVRNYIRNLTIKQSRNYREMIQTLTLDEVLYNVIKDCFRGGDTHANPNYVAKTLSNVASYDLTSAYPAAMVLRTFPMSTPILDEHICSDIDLDYIASQPSKYFIANIEFTNLIATTHITHPLSFSKTLPRIKSTAVIDNGRIVSTEFTSTTICELDWLVYRKYYKWDSIKINYCFTGRRAYLPTLFVKAVLGLYKNKTELKGVRGKEREYMIAKNMTNSSYGMTVTDPVKDEIILDNDDEEKPFHAIASNLAEALDNLNHSKNRFLYYLWGVWTTAWCRYELYQAIDEFGDDFVYCDTDSAKGLHGEIHSKWIDKENASILALIEKSSKFHRLPMSLYCPKSKSGKEYPIGLWDYEGNYDRFKTMGSKRYLVEKDGKYQLTISGVRKKAVAWLMKDTKIDPCLDDSLLASHFDDELFCEPFDGYRADPFKSFDWGQHFPRGVAGRTVHTYIDREISGTMTDYLGNKGEYYEKSALFVEQSEYRMDPLEDFKNFYKMIQSKEASI